LAMNQAPQVNQRMPAANAIFAVGHANKNAKKARHAVFSAAQLAGLLNSFMHNAYLSKTNREALCNALGLTEIQVKTWFQRYRTKRRRQWPAAWLRTDEDETYNDSVDGYETP
ncbi:hypothetical protein PENTCL1PPCAC_9580, partial [Pristionchus entomophagus]